MSRQVQYLKAFAIELSIVDHINEARETDVTLYFEERYKKQLERYATRHEPIPQFKIRCANMWYKFENFSFGPLQESKGELMEGWKVNCSADDLTGLALLKPWRKTA